MRNLIGLLLLVSGIFASHGCSADTKSTQPAVIPPSPASSPVTNPDGKAKAGSSAAPGETS
jgi:hypothetical protein